MKKNKKNSIFIFLIIIVLVLMCIPVLYHFSGMGTTKNNYNKYVQLIKNSNLYTKSDNNYISSGSISKGVNIELEKLESRKEEYYKIKDTEYYVYYKDLKKVDKLENNNINENYLVFNMNVLTNDKTRLENNDTYIEINKGIDLPIQYMDENNYYVNYMSNIYSIKKDGVSTKEADNTKDEESENISILNYLKVNIDKLDEQFKYLKENNYYTITKEDYKKWINKYIRLKKGATLLIQDEENNEILSKAKENNLTMELTDNDMKFVNNNKTTTNNLSLDNLYRYTVDDNTSIDDYKKMCEGVDLSSILPDNSVNKSGGIAVINYHFFYDSSLNENCGEDICLDTYKFKEQLQYLKDNGFKTLKMKEFVDWIYGEKDLPEKSVLLTIDDGAMGTGAHNGNKLIPILEEYDMYATLFLITGWWDISNYKSDHLDVESHTFDMHKGMSCKSEPRGAQMLCNPYEKVVEDLKKSVEITGSTDAFCYPFYLYNYKAIQAVKEVGFKVAFAGGNVKATRNSDKYKIPRYPIYDHTTIEQFKNMVN